MRHALVTGSGGFVGRALMAALPVPSATLALGPEDWERRIDNAAFAGATVFHLAARVHRREEPDEGAFHIDNVEKTRRLAEVAALRGAQRFVFLSSIKVHGEESPGRGFVPEDIPAPFDAYARSKLEAERAVRELGDSGRLRTAVVRSPLVLGAGASGNLASLMALADSPWPLPFASIRNRRSLVHVSDLARLLVACGTAPMPAATTFIAAHRAAVSTPELVATMRRALGRAERLVACPPPLLEAAAGAAGMGARMRRLTRSLEADPTTAEAALGWRATIDPCTAAIEMACAWRAQRT